GSAFGAMIAPRPELAARELFRVARPGGTVGMTAWVPGSFTAELIQIGRKYVPPPAEQPLAEEWGVEETVRERFGPLAGSVEREAAAGVRRDGFRRLGGAARAADGAGGRRGGARRGARPRAPADRRGPYGRRGARSRPGRQPLRGARLRERPEWGAATGRAG